MNNDVEPDLAERQFRLKVCNILFVPWLLYAYEIRTLKQKATRRLKGKDEIETHGRIQFIRNKNILEELKIDPHKNISTV
jgi:predicted glycosyltransferase